MSVIWDDDEPGDDTAAPLTKAEYLQCYEEALRSIYVMLHDDPSPRARNARLIIAAVLDLPNPERDAAG
jgi:hypothetical protein